MPVVTNCLHRVEVGLLGKKLSFCNGEILGSNPVAALVLLFILGIQFFFNIILISVCTQTLYVAYNISAQWITFKLMEIINVFYEIFFKLILLIGQGHVLQ